MIRSYRDRPDAESGEDLFDVENPELWEKELDYADGLLEQEREWDRQLEAGEITEARYLAEYDPALRIKKVRAGSRPGYLRESITDEQISDEAELHKTLDSGNVEVSMLVDRVEKAVDTLGPERAQELADEMLEDGELSEKGHETVSRKTGADQK